MFTRRIRRTLVFLTIILGFAGMQAYALHAVYTGLALHEFWVAPLFAWGLLMTFFPFLLWRLERSGWHRTATTGAWIGYGWMGFVFLFFWVALAINSIGRLAFASSAVVGAGVTPAFVITLAIVAYGVIAATRPRTERVTIVSPKLPADQVLRIAFISDLHLGALVGKRALGRVMKRLEQLAPDMLLSSGDLVDGQADRLNRLVPMLATFKPRLGKYAVMGNHECYVGIDHALDFHARAGFTVLRGAAVAATPQLVIAGVDDPAAASVGHRHGLNEQGALAAVAPQSYSILLKHQPVVTPEDAPRADLQLSGHVHQGQIFPFNFLVRLVYRRPTGLSTLPGGAQLYISRGTGTWGPPMRVLAPGEITLFELRGPSAQ